MAPEPEFERRDVYPQAAVVPWRRRDGRIEVLMITSASGKRWVLPKGLIDPGETAPESAAREAEEEAGVAGEVDPEPLGTYRYRKWGGVCEVEVFLMRVTDVRGQWSEQDVREREWITVDEAVERSRGADLADLLRRLPARIEGGRP